jgi:hypothetical protein
MSDGRAPPPVVRPGALDDEADEATVDLGSLGDAFPAARVARISAAIDLEPPHRADILAASEIDAAQWDAIEDRATNEILAAAKRGAADPLADFDAVYLERLEDERGEVSLDDFARLLVAEERGATPDVARELELPMGALMRIARAWHRRAAADPAIAFDLRRAVQAWRAR